MNMAKILAEHNRYPNDRTVLKKLFGNYNISVSILVNIFLKFDSFSFALSKDID